MNDLLIKELQAISGTDVNSYSFVHLIIEMINKNGRQYQDDLTEILQKGKRK